MTTKDLCLSAWLKDFSRQGSDDFEGKDSDIDKITFGLSGRFLIWEAKSGNSTILVDFETGAVIQ